MGKFIDLTNQIFGRLTVISRCEAPGHISKGEKNRAYFLCKCDCGIEVIIPGSHLKGLKRTSCGNHKTLTNSNNAKISSAKHTFNAHYKDGNLKFDQFYLLSQMNCHYCNSPPINKSNCFKSKATASSFSKENGDFIYNGLDRINSLKNHDIDNVVPCCIICNKMKSNLTIELFESQIEKIYRFYHLNK